MTITVSNDAADFTAAAVTRAAKQRRRRAGDLRRLADDLGHTLEPLRLAAMRRAAEAELTSTALLAVAEGLGAEPVQTDDPSDLAA